jgi:hypothetical protein
MFVAINTSYSDDIWKINRLNVNGAKKPEAEGLFNLFQPRPLATNFTHSGIMRIAYVLSRHSKTTLYWRGVFAGRIYPSSTKLISTQPLHTQSPVQNNFVLTGCICRPNIPQQYKVDFNAASTYAISRSKQLCTDGVYLQAEYTPAVQSWFQRSLHIRNLPFKTTLYWRGVFAGRLYHRSTMWSSTQPLQRQSPVKTRRVYLQTEYTPAVQSWFQRSLHIRNLPFKTTLYW